MAARGTMAMTTGAARLGWSWRDGPVSPDGDYMQLLYGARDAEPEAWVPVARVGPAEGRVFPVEWLIAREAAAHKDMVAAAVRDLDFYLTEVGGADPWSYAQYHAGTASNWYGSIHWGSCVRSVSRAT